jgi:amino acid transporter
MADISNRKLSTFLGVYTPTVLTILGAIMFLRSGWLVGHLGISHALVIVVIANAITLITTLSFSSVATNIRVGVGGAYYIISRSLGIEIGGAIGFPLFLSQAFSVTLYAFGLAESLRLVMPDVPVQAAAFIIILVVSVLSFIGASYALKAQMPVMVFIGVSIIALVVGAIMKSSGTQLPVFPPSGEITFWHGFAVFFPAVTGVMAGLGLSGDLKNPGRSIPLGALLAVMTGFVIYMFLPVFLAMGASPEELRTNPMIWAKIAPLGVWLILPGLWGAIFSSAVGSMLGAPRTLQALSRDGLLPGFLRGKKGGIFELAPGFVVSIAIALGAVLLGNLNAVAPVATMFFLTIYGTLNIVSAIETISGDTSWRPKLRVPWIISLVGGIGCFVAMFLINPLFGMIAILAEILLWSFFSRRERTRRWGDARRGVFESLIRWALLRLKSHPMSARNWRPHVLVFVSDPIKQIDLIRFGDWFSHGRGVVTVCELIVADLLSDNLDLINKRTQIQNIMDKEHLVVFAEVNVVNDVVEGITNVSQANGMAGLQSNTVMLGLPKNRELLVEFLRVMHRLEHLKKSLIIGRAQSGHYSSKDSSRRKILVWWRGMQYNGDLMLLLAYLLKRNPEWHGAHVQVMSIAPDHIMKDSIERNLKKLISEIRIDAEPHVMIKPEGQSVTDFIHQESLNADAVFFGLATPKKGEEMEYSKRMEELARDLPTVFFVKNSSMFIGELLKSDEE